MKTLTKSTGTVTLSGAVEKVVLPAVYGWVWFWNKSDSDMYAGTLASIIQGADGVATIPAGGFRRIQTDGFKSVYLLGTGNVEISAQNYADCPFKVGGKGGEIPDLSAYAKKTDVPNENLLINPDFKINQRGLTEYSGPQYTVDRWFCDANSKVTVDSNGITVTATADVSQEWWGIYQKIENASSYIGLPITISAYVTEFTGEWYIPTPTNSGEGRVSITKTGINTIHVSNLNVIHNFGIAMANVKTGDYIKIKWMKVEVGQSATQFVPPEPITELLKCQRYYQIRSENNIAAVDLRPNMRDGVVPTITALADGNYSYSTEL